MNITAVVGVTVLAAFLAVLLRRQHPEFAMGIGLAAGIVLLVFLMNCLIL